MTLDEAIAVFDKSAYAQTEAWAVIRAELMRVLGARIATLSRSDVGAWNLPDSWSGLRVRLLAVPERSE